MVVRWFFFFAWKNIQKQPSRVVPRKRCSGNMHLQYAFTLRLGCSPVNLLYIFRTPFTKNNSGRLSLNIFSSGRSFYFEISSLLKTYLNGKNRISFCNIAEFFFFSFTTGKYMTSCWVRFTDLSSAELLLLKAYRCTQ